MERLSLEKLQILLTKALDDDFQKRALIGPLIHQFDDQYYAAAIAYIMSGEKTIIRESYLTTEKIEREFSCNYLEALCILNNVKKFPEQADFIMHFDEVE